MEFLGRLFAYPDTHRYRLGPNFQQLPINCAFLSADLTLHILSLNFNRCAGPYRARVVTHQRDGPMCMVSKNPQSPALERFCHSQQHCHTPFLHIASHNPPAQLRQRPQLLSKQLVCHQAQSLAHFTFSFLVPLVNRPTCPRDTKVPDATKDTRGGASGRYEARKDQDDFVQAGNLFRLMTPKDKDHLIDNIGKSLGV